MPQNATKTFLFSSVELFRRNTGPNMISIDLNGKVALVTGVGDNLSFAWFISKKLQAAGAKVVLACHPRML